MPYDTKSDKHLLREPEHQSTKTPPKHDNHDDLRRQRPTHISTTRTKQQPTIIQHFLQNPRPNITEQQGHHSNATRPVFTKDVEEGPRRWTCTNWRGVRAQENTSDEDHHGRRPESGVTTLFEEETKPTTMSTPSQTRSLQAEVTNYQIPFTTGRRRADNQTTKSAV